jgi:hypothetical protein
MVKLIKWLDRKFDFTQPAGLMPVNLERMLGSIVKIEKLFMDCSDAELSYKPDNAWSIKENIGHMTDVEELHETRLKQILSGENALAAADMSNKKTIAANHNSRNAQDIYSDFKVTRTAFVDRLKLLNEEQVLLSGHHPRLNKPMRIIDIAYFTAEHDDHHFAVISEIRKQYRKNEQ